MTRSEGSKPKERQPVRNGGWMANGGHGRKMLNFNFWLVVGNNVIPLHNFKASVWSAKYKYALCY